MKIIDNNSINKDTIWGLCTNYTSSNPDALDDLGVSTIRFDLDWEKVESKEDVFRVPTYFDNMVNKSKGEYAYTVIDSDTEASAEAINALKKINGIIRIRVIK